VWTLAFLLQNGEAAKFHREKQMTMKKLTVFMLTAALLLSTSSLPLLAQQVGNANTNRLTVPISGTVNGAAGTLTGSVAISRFATQNGNLVAIGTLTATVTDGAGTILRTIVQPVTLPVTQATGTCPILHLELGPLDLTVLGLVVHLDKIVLDITAQSGPGNLLGNLLCAVAGLLDSNNLGAQLVNLLNQILGVLAGL
jgi:hypothetical protein